MLFGDAAFGIEAPVTERRMSAELRLSQGALVFPEVLVRPQEHKSAVVLVIDTSLQRTLSGHSGALVSPDQRPSETHAAREHCV